SDQQKKDLQTQIQAAPDADKAALKQQLDQVLLEEKVLNILVGAVTGLGGTAVTKEILKAAAEQMRDAMIEDSKKFPGVVDAQGNVLNNLKAGLSEGVNGDGQKVGGTRVDLDQLCGAGNARCTFEKLADGSIDTSKPVRFTGGNNDDGTPKNQSLDDFLKTPEGQKMEGLTGGIQGVQGTLFGVPYTAGSWQDKLIESFAGSHDVIGGKLSGLYDEQGNIKQGMTDAERSMYDKVITTAAIPVAAPFAAAQGLPPEVWKAISVLLGAAK
nr:adhesin [Pseudomonadota bacterium]